LQNRSWGDVFIEVGDVLTFEAIAALGQGEERLGVLVADVDQLGLVMSEGLRTAAKKPSLMRAAALSRMLDLFFSGYLNTICQHVSDQNSADQKNSSGLFYILYAGGDDLFIVGPWYEVLLLAMRINEEFHTYCADNPHMSISAGYVQVKPRYPVQKFAALAKEAEKHAKNEGRNRIHLFNHTVTWKGDFGLDRMLNEVQAWLSAIDNKEMNRGMIYDLGELYRVHLTSKGQLKPLWTPRLYYTLARRLSKDALARYKDRLLQVIASGKVLVPVSITSLLIRERRK
jgi:CRISPR-associated protein Csm1